MFGICFQSWGGGQERKGGGERLFFKVCVNPVGG